MAERDSKGRFIGKGGGGSGSPVVTVGGNAQGATDAFEKVREEMRKTGEEARRTSTRIGGVFRGLGGMFTGLKSVMGGVFSFMRTVGSTVLSVLGAAYNKLKYAVLGVAGVLGYSYHAWNNEAKQQVRIGNLLRNNVRNYREAGRELDKMISRVQRTTNFADDDVRGIFGALIQWTGSRGFNLGKQLTPAIMDFAAARGFDVETIADGIGKAIRTGNSSVLRRQGFPVDDKAFKSDPAAAIIAAIGKVAPGTAAEERAAAPLQGMLNNLGDVFENLGRIVATKVNPYIERFSNFFQNIAEATGESTWGDLFESVKTYAADAFEFIRAYGVAGYESLQANIGTIVQSTLETVGSGFLKIAQDFGPQVAKAISDTLRENLPGNDDSWSKTLANWGQMPFWQKAYSLTPFGNFARFSGAVSGWFNSGVPKGFGPGTPSQAVKQQAAAAAAPPPHGYTGIYGAMVTQGQKIAKGLGLPSNVKPGPSMFPISSTGQSSPYSGGAPFGTGKLIANPNAQQRTLNIPGYSSAPASTGGASPFVYTASAHGPVAGALSSLNSRAQQIYQQNTGRTMAQGPLGQAASRFMAGGGGGASMPWSDAEYIASGGRLRDALAGAQSPQAYAEAARTYSRERSDLAIYGRYWEQQDPQALLQQFSKARPAAAPAASVERSRARTVKEELADNARAMADVRRSVDSNNIGRRRGALMPAF